MSNKAFLESESIEGKILDRNYESQEDYGRYSLKYFNGTIARTALNSSGLTIILNEEKKPFYLRAPSEGIQRMLPGENIKIITDSSSANSRFVRYVEGYEIMDTQGNVTSRYLSNSIAFKQAFRYEEYYDEYQTKET